jgi:hypothetical protein
MDAQIGLFIADEARSGQAQGALARVLSDGRGGTALPANAGATREDGVDRGLTHAASACS